MVGTDYIYWQTKRQMDDHPCTVATTTNGIQIKLYDQKLSCCCLAHPLEEQIFFSHQYPGLSFGITCSLLILLWVRAAGLCLPNRYCQVGICSGGRYSLADRYCYHQPAGPAYGYRKSRKKFKNRITSS